jgi:hypothetical protein
VDNERRRAVVIGAAAGGISGLIVLLAIRNRAGSDFIAHVALTKAGLNGGWFPGDVLFYWIESVLALFRPHNRRLFAGLVVMLAVAGGVKTYLTVRLAETEYRRRTGARLPLAGALLAAACMFAFGLPFGLRYPQFIPANVWHNTTTALLMPLALGLFMVSIAYLREPSRRLLWSMLGLLVVNILAKPSFALCFLVAFPVAVFLRHRRPAALAGPILVCVAGGVVLFAQYVYIYVAGLGNPLVQSSGVYVAPFHVWSRYTPSIPLCLVASYAFPIAALALGGPAVRGRLTVRYALGLAVAGLAWFALMGEKGHQEFHGNFMWQAIVTSYILFAAVIGAVLTGLRTTRFGWRQAIVLAVFGLHVAGGLQYLAWWLTYNAP